jgi:DNA-binding LacI/PurR family transcriptional regulator
LKSGTLQGNKIRGKIRTVAVNCAPILVCTKNVGKTAVEIATNEMVLGAMQVLCEFSLLVSQQNHSDLSLTALDDAPNQFSQKKGIFGEQKMSKPVKANVNSLLATEAQQLREQMIHMIRAAMEALVYAAQKVASTKRRQFQVRLNRTQQAATT